jgi:hypothetical protein
MNPQDIFEYKLKWKPNAYIVHVHSDLDVQCKSWCRRYLQRFEWSMDTYTDVYSHSFYFEHELHSKEFAQEFFEWVDKGRR